MLRIMKWVAPMVGLSMLIGLPQLARAADGTVAAKATVHVTVLDQDGKAVENVRVRLVLDTGANSRADSKLAAPGKKAKAPAKGKVKRAVDAATDKDGKLNLANVPDGQYTIMAVLKGGGRGMSSVNVEDGNDASVTVTLKEKKAKRVT